jgi:hypothetical protein
MIKGRSVLDSVELSMLLLTSSLMSTEHKIVLLYIVRKERRGNVIERMISMR